MKPAAPHLATRGGMDRATTALRCLGLGLFLSLCPRGPVNTVLLGTCLDGWAWLTLAQTVHLAASGLAGLALWGLARQGLVLPRALTARTCYAAVAVCLAGQFVSGMLGLGAWPVCVLAFAMGAFSAYVLMLWFEMLLDVCRTAGRAACIATLSGCYGVAMASSLPASLAAMHPLATLGVTCASVATCWWCHELLERCRTAQEPSARHNGGAPRRSRYQLVFHTLATLASFGVTYGIAQNLATYFGASGTFARVVSVVAVAGVCFGLMALFFASKTAGSLQFGYVIRIAITVGGSILAVVPFAADLAPGLTGTLLRCAGTLLGMAMILFSVEICNDTGGHAWEVIPLNYSVWALVCSVAMAGSMGVLELSGGHRALDLVVTLAVVATLVIIPILPSRSGNAATFTLSELPEDEGFEGRTARARESLVAKRGLSGREEEVLGLLLEGRTRQEIADRLMLSTWTVKDHAKNIYRKLDVHSAKELMALFARGE